MVVVVFEDKFGARYFRTNGRVRYFTPTKAHARSVSVSHGRRLINFLNSKVQGSYRLEAC